MFVGTSGSRVIRRSTTSASERAANEMEPSGNPRRTEFMGPVPSLEGDELKPVKMRPLESSATKSLPTSDQMRAKLSNDPSEASAERVYIQEKSVFSHALSTMLQPDDVRSVIKTQRNTRRRYEEINEMVKQFNELSELTFQELQEQFKGHVKLLLTLKKDLDNIFRRIRVVKVKLKEKYPEAFEVTAEAIEKLKERYMMEDEEYEKMRLQNELSTTEPGNDFSGDIESYPGPTENSLLEPVDNPLVHSKIETENSCAQETDAVTDEFRLMEIKKDENEGLSVTGEDLENSKKCEAEHASKTCEVEQDNNEKFEKSESNKRLDYKNNTEEGIP